MQWIWGLALIAGCDYVVGIDQVTAPPPPVDAVGADGVALDAAPGTIAFVEDNATYPAVPRTDLALRLMDVLPGDFELVFVTWVGLGAVDSVRDNEGPLMALDGPAATQNMLHLATFYRASATQEQKPANIAITFTSTVTGADARALQYRGARQQPLDAIAVGVGTGSNLEATVTTTVANDLVIGATHCATACMPVDTRVRGYLMTSGNFAAEVGPALTGPVTIAATQNPAADWILQLIAISPN